MLEFISKMSVTDWIAITAIIISILAGVLNYTYTKKTFAAAFFPKVMFTPRVKTCSGGSCFSLKLKNLSQTYALSEIILNISILPPRKLLLFGQRRINLYQGKFPNLIPAQEINIERIPDNSHHNLEEFCSVNFPDWIQTVNTSIGGKIYALTHDKKAKIIVTLTYTPGVMGTENVRIKKQFDLIPGYHEEIRKIKQINGWEIK